jgi:Flp pilus assembly protein TadD
MKDIPWPDSHYVTAAIGWLGLGAPREAAEELNNLSPGLVDHPDVLEIRWEIFATRKEWEQALDNARQLLQKAPTRVAGWVHQAYALRRVRGGGLEKARNALLPAYKIFPDEDIIPFNLACYAAQLGSLDEAWDWLEKAMVSAGSKEKIKHRALADDDLRPLWGRLKEMA